MVWTREGLQSCTNRLGQYWLPQPFFSAHWCRRSKQQQRWLQQKRRRGMLAAQIRMQSFICDKPLGAVRDAKRSRPDRAVWVLKCSNAAYRITRAPDMAAKVQPLQ
jgi:hypothetical protein